MKQTLIPIVMILALFAAYSHGQANQKQPLKNCCCEHTQQIAEDLRWIRESMSKSFKRPPDIVIQDPGEFEDAEFTTPDLPELKPNFPKFKSPKKR